METKLLHPIDFQVAWGLKTEDAAQILGFQSPVSLRRYSCRSKKTHTEPSAPVKRLAATITELWLLQGKQPANPEILEDLLD